MLLDDCFWWNCHTKNLFLETFLQLQRYFHVNTIVFAPIAHAKWLISRFRRAGKRIESWCSHRVLWQTSSWRHRLPLRHAAFGGMPWVPGWKYPNWARNRSKKATNGIERFLEKYKTKFQFQIFQKLFRNFSTYFSNMQFVSPNWNATSHEHHRHSPTRWPSGGSCEHSELDGYRE